MKTEFHKYQGTGNDFIILDNRKNLYDEITEKQVAFICNRHFGVGADGLMLLNLTEGYDFEMKYFNANGAEGSMCGNGARCMVKFAEHKGIRKHNYHFKAVDGAHKAEFDMNGIIKLKMNDVNKVETYMNHFVLDTGSPHYVKPGGNVLQLDVKNAGKSIRYSKEFEQDGINVNFVETLDNDTIYVRTYERGVEDETLSCGTGVTASALVSAHNDNGFNHVDIKTPGGNLSVEFDKKDDNTFENIWLIGPANFVFKGELELQ
ncbi:MAG: diaminopimelate epimerase [Chitinophagaceae bacterium]|nr:diaminopimelate epimerase [Chitinophagaceae bacterium]